MIRLGERPLGGAVTERRASVPAKLRPNRNEVLTAPTYVGVTVNKAATATLAVTIPSGTQEGDLLMLSGGLNGSGLTGVAVSGGGWTTHNTDNLFNVFAWGGFCKLASAADETNAGSGTYTIQALAGTATVASGSMTAYRGAQDTLVLAGQTISNAATWTQVGVDPFLFDDVRIDNGYSRIIHATIHSNARRAITWDGAFTERAETASGSGALVTAGVATQAMPRPGSYPVGTNTLSSIAAFIAAYYLIIPAQE